MHLEIIPCLKFKNIGDDRRHPPLKNYSLRWNYKFHRGQKDMDLWLDRQMAPSQYYLALKVQLFLHFFRYKHTQDENHLYFFIGQKYRIKDFF